MPDPTPAAAPAQEEPKVVTQDTLLKSLQDIEKLAKGETVEEPAAAAPTVETIEAPAKTADAITEAASEDLKKGLNASPLLTEIVASLGKAVDAALEPLAKALNSAMERDTAIAGTLETLTKSVGELGGKVETIGKEPAAPADARPVTAQPEDVLRKAGAEGDPAGGEQDPVKRAGIAKRMVLTGLEKLVKSSTEPQDQKRFTNALIKFESTGVIDDVMLAEARSAMAPPAAAAH